MHTTVWSCLFLFLSIFFQNFFSYYLRITLILYLRSSRKRRKMKVSWSPCGGWSPTFLVKRACLCLFVLLEMSLLLISIYEYKIYLKTIKHISISLFYDSECTKYFCRIVAIIEKILFNLTLFRQIRRLMHK